MKRKVLETLFRGKVEAELWKLRREFSCLEPEEVFENANEIDSKMKICGILLETVRELPEEVLWAMLPLPDIIGSFYCKWLETEKFRMGQMREYLLAGLTGQDGGYMIEERSERGKNVA